MFLFVFVHMFVFVDLFILLFLIQFLFVICYITLYLYKLLVFVVMVGPLHVIHKSAPHSGYEDISCWESFGEKNLGKQKWK